MLVFQHSYICWLRCGIMKILPQKVCQTNGANLWVSPAAFFVGMLVFHISAVELLCARGWVFSFGTASNHWWNRIRIGQIKQRQRAVFVTANPADLCPKTE